jgi:hypothetical protein
VVASTALTAAAVGAGVEFFLDPRSGRRRRKLVRDRARGAIRRRRRRVERQAHYEAGKVIGIAHAIAHRGRGARELDDVGLVHKVESELFRDRTIPKGEISINVDRGIVVLRGELADERQIVWTERAVRKVVGVREVENLLHLPGLPAPPSQPHGTTRPARLRERRRLRGGDRGKEGRWLSQLEITSSPRRSRPSVLLAVV